MEIVYLFFGPAFFVFLVSQNFTAFLITFLITISLIVLLLVQITNWKTGKKK